MVRVYTLSTCPWCKKVRKFLDEKNVPYQCVEVDTISGEDQENALQEVMRLTGSRNFPVTVINGAVIRGYQPEKIMEALQDDK